MDDYLYLFHGYDVSNYVINEVSIERIKVDVNEACCLQDPGFNSSYVVKVDKLGPYVRPFTAIYPSHNNNKIIYFGYSGLEEDSDQPLDQNDLIRSDPNQICHKYTVIDEYPRYHQHRQLLDWEREEYEEVVKEL